VPLPFGSTGWKTVWLDHLSFSATNYKKSVSFYTNLLGWTPTYDEGSQNECLIGDVGNMIIRGGNPLDPAFEKGSGRGGARIDHISFGIVGHGRRHGGARNTRAESTHRYVEQASFVGGQVGAR
jgi:catechol 2,3-dioxygenase-like lactoylglutathione lyase family enzyme